MFVGMKETKVDIDYEYSRHPVTNELIRSDEPRLKVTLGNFIKFMIVNDGICDEDVLEYFGTNFSLLYRLLKDVNWNTCRLSPTSSIKTELMEKMKIKEAIYDRHIGSYVSLGLMKRIGRGEYMINPMKVFMGDAEEQRKMIISYTERKEYGKK